ncbi:MAG: flagellar basal-body rod protein FlgF [Methyloligellaceae bacterium]
MDTSLYVGLSGQIALQRRLDTIAGNVANAGTVGFRSEQVKFETLLNREEFEPITFASRGEIFTSTKSGEMVRTDNPLDVALTGNAWLAIDTSAGAVYTRDGRMQIDESGALQTLNGYAVLDVGGAPIQLNPNGGPLLIASDGMITQNGNQGGALGLFQIRDGAKLTRFDNSGVIPDTPAEPVLEFSRSGVAQGYVERSNVNPVLEMTRLIEVTRAFQAMSKAVEDTDGTFREAIRTLGGNKSA